jgi:hypothetical protein
MNVQELENVLSSICNNTEIIIEESYGLKYKIKDYRLEQTSTTEKLYLITEKSPVLNIIKDEDPTSTESIK